MDNNMRQIWELFVLGCPSPHTRSNYNADMTALDAFVKGFTGHEDAVSILRFIRYQETTMYLKPTTIKGRAIRLRRFYQYLIDNNRRLPPNPVSLGSVPKVKDTRTPRCLDNTEFLNLGRVLEQNSLEGLQDTLIIALMAYDGLRVGEVSKLKRSDVEIIDVGIKIQVTGKMGLLSSPFLWPQSQNLMHEYLRRMTYLNYKSPLFPSPKNSSRPLTTRTIRRRVEYYFKLAGVRPGLSCHALRHFLATSLQQNGVPITAIQKKLRHTDIAVTFRYLQDVPSRSHMAESEMHNLLPELKSEVQNESK